LFKELAEINQHPFGKTILAAVATNLRAKTPISDVQDLLQSILNGLVADASLAQSNFNTAQANLQAQISDDTQLISSISASITALQASLLANQGSLSDDQATLTSVQTSLTAASDDLAAINSDYNTKKPNYDQDLLDLSEAIAACQQAQTTMSSYSSATASSLIQIASSAKRELQHFSETMGGMKSKLSKHGTMYSPLIHELLAMTQNPEADQASQVVTLLGNLITLLQQAYANLSNQASTYEANYANQVATDQANIQAYQVQIAQIQTDITNLQTQISQQQTQLAAAQDLLSTTQNQLSNAQNALSTLQSNYATASANFQTLIGLLNQVINQFNNNVAGVDDWTASQINGNGF